ncbi:MAG: hypothetical protein L0216_02070 [Planctomycetales bacterium]|nr:hypothetical protein [Planctomycetales bacterium]
MPRTTLNIDGPILEEVKRRGRAERKPLGRLVSELLAQVLARGGPRKPVRKPLRWIVRDLKPRVDLSDKDALYEILRQEDLRKLLS